MWVIDGKQLSAGAHAHWNPAPGRHTLALLDRGGRLADTVVFQMRGQLPAGARTGSTGTHAGIIDSSSRLSD
jgi:hypothetical protein